MEIDRMKIDLDKFLNDLEGLIKIPSVSSHLEEVERALLYIIELGRKNDLNSYTVLNNRVGVIELGNGDEALGILVHVDVVSEGDPSKWTSHPFKMEVRDGNIYGRGVADDKGAAISIIHIMKHFKKYEHLMKKKIQLIIGTQEEVEWTDMDDYVKQFKLPDYGFTPDGEFPITNIEKGYTDISVKFKINDYGDVIDFNAGTSLNSIPDLAKLIISKKNKDSLLDSEVEFKESNDGIEIIKETVSAHSCHPQKGINAIWEIVKAFNNSEVKLGDFKRAFDFIRDESIGDYYGKNFGFENEITTYNGQDIDKTVMSPTRLYIKDDHLIINFNIRQTLGVDKEVINNSFEQKGLIYEFEHTIDNYLEFLYVDQNKPFIEKMVIAYEEETEFKNVFNIAHGTSYAKAMKNFVAWGPYFENEIDSCHEVDEHLNLENLMKAIRIYSRAIENIVFTHEKLV